MLEIEKRTGHDWTVVFRDTDNSLMVASLFGVNTMEQAAKQAHADCAMPEECDIVAIIRDRDAAEVLKEIA